MTKALTVTNLLEQAGLTQLAKVQKALDYGFKKIPQRDVAKFADKLRERGQEFDFHNPETYEPADRELIPTKELINMKKSRKLDIFDKTIVVGTRTHVEKLPNPDPLVVGLFLTDNEFWAIHRNGLANDSVRNIICQKDWYLIAAWK